MDYNIYASIFFRVEYNVREMKVIGTSLEVR